MARNLFVSPIGLDTGMTPADLERADGLSRELEWILANPTSRGLVFDLGTWLLGNHNTIIDALRAKETPDVTN
jgi:hypothetical protein